MGQTAERSKLKDVVIGWKHEVGLDAILHSRRETTLIHFEESTNTLFIITKYPGYFIGKNGSTVNKYKQRIKDKLGIDVTIKLVEPMYQNVKEF